MKNYRYKMSELEYLNAIRPVLKQKQEIDIDFHNLIDSSLDNYYNLTDEEYNQLMGLIEDSKELPKTKNVQINVIKGTNKALFNFMAPYKLSKPITRVRTIEGRFETTSQTVEMSIVKPNYKNENSKKLMLSA